jgi:hypothetical protein
MNSKFRTVATAILAVSLAAPFAHASDKDPGTKPKKHSTAAAAAKKPVCDACDQIQALKTDMQSQLDAMKQELAAKDAALAAAQKAAADAQAAADRANAAVSAQNQAVTDNATAVTSLQTTVTDLKANAVSLASTVSDETAAMKKSINSPNVLHFRGVEITPGGFAAGESVYRSKATGGDIPTAFSGIPYEHADAYSLSEFFGSGRQSRVSMMVEGKTGWGTLRGYYEADWLGTGITSNNNQSNSYVLRQRVIWAQAETKSHWAFTGGQMWSMATEDKKGISNLSGDIMTPQTIDPNYVPGFVWTRQYGFRVTKTFKNIAFGVAAENPQLLYTASLAGNTPYAVIGSQGTNGGNYNGGINACTPATSIVNYTNQADLSATGGAAAIAVPVYKTVNGCANLANLSFNQAPDMIAKIAIDPGWGHYEIFGIAGFAHETVYPGETTNSNLYGGLTDIATGTAVAPALTASGAYYNNIVLGGFGGSLRMPIIKDKLNVGFKGLYGPGMGRYGDTTLADVTARSDGELAPIHNASGLITIEANPTPRLALYLNYGGDYAGRTDYGSTTTTTLGAPSADFCATVAGVLTCAASPTAALVAAGGKWGGHWGAPSAAAVGYGSRLLSNSGCNTTTNPGYNGGASTGYAAGGSCGAQTRDVQEMTGGYWYDIYKGDHGRLRQGIQYGYAVREGWSGAGTPAIGAKGIDNMFWTSFRYYLP